MRIALRLLAAIFFLTTGVSHFLRAALFKEIVPPMFPAPALLVQISGICEIAGGLGLLIPPLRRSAGWGLIALLIAVFPANIYMAVSPQSMPDIHLPQWLLWLRLPLQPLMIAWVWYIARV